LKIFCLLLCCFLLHPGMGYSQGLAPASVKSMDTLAVRFHFIPFYQYKAAVHKTANQPNKRPFRSPYDHHDALGFFCKWELKMDKQVRQAIRFRLGSVDYVNRMEGKQ